MKHILIVDDDKVTLASAKKLLSRTYRVTAVTSGGQAIKFLENNKCDMILLDINMPEPDGFQTMERITAMLDSPPPIIFLTADSDEKTESRCLKAGAMDFIAKPFSETVALSRISRILELSEMKNDLEVKLEERTRHIRHIQEMMVLGMAAMVESRDNGTGEHIKRTSEVVKIFSRKLTGITPELSEDFLGMVTRAAPMHDLGKIAVDDVILRKQGRFTDEEYAAMKKHSAEGAKIVEQILKDIEKESFVKTAVNVAHYHHEKWDGSGYPTGLSGENIPIEARIMALADVFDALVSKRCYKEAYSYDRAFLIIENSLGSHFDPELGRIFMTCRPELEALYSGC
ncbi:MAG: response regulator [Ruminococcus sp.]|nr:response regulator [Ruminococcus sp.]